MLPYGKSVPRGPQELSDFFHLLLYFVALKKYEITSSLFLCPMFQPDSPLREVCCLPEVQIKTMSLHPALRSSAQERYGTAGADPEERQTKLAEGFPLL